MSDNREERLEQTGGAAGAESPTIRRSDELDRRYRRNARLGIAASLLLHALLFLILAGRGTPIVPESAAGPRAGDDEAAAAPGGAMRAVRVRAPVEPEIVRPEIPLPTIEITVEFEESQAEIEPVAFDQLGLGGDADGPDEGDAGIEGGTGRGDGGTAAEGRFRVIPPSPRGMILPPSNRPRNVRGKEVTIFVFVTERGRVVPDSTLIRPGSGDRGFDETLRRQASEWVFEPARRGGEPVAEWFRYVISM